MGYFIRSIRTYLYNLEIAFNWPVNCPLEVMELVGRERFNANNPKYMMPFFWMSEPVPATRSWGIIVCAIEWMFGLICLLFNILHFGIYLPKYKGNGIPGTVFFVTLIQFSIFYANKVLFIIALIEKRVRLLKQQLIFQYATSVILLINVSFTVAADAGGYDEQNLYASKNPILIRFVAFLSFIFIFVQLFLRWMTVSVYSFLRDTRRFIQAVENSMLRYRKRVFFTYCSIVFENTQNMKKPVSFIFCFFF
ncbi:unnamed protein product [Dracunculus medinensis]|uniref:Uncharacterized protein n=1 Tax=Dracunculus medinensis TaxID=318479 RepID=A0A0N4U9V7_DRAME|nr:unnamed protein product [Dracunculus medinensis]